ncbi:hypothetical protein GH740_01940 [Microbacterium sp. SYP-A9085]|uniref:hypothetical protein n=1 Tax=Microbacterium sp. SYP-A9085 TaxID=2664454 RepID=UPI00129AAC59|nr:hypothetical protein [Microbacterium sp. SYP-A9085]MRH28076.1 hypothetical protein [Microbacterium sp. SYP-A9085]
MSTTQPTSAAKAIAIVAIVLGGLVATGSAVSAAASTVASASVHTTSRSLPVTGVDALDVDLSAGALRVEFADVDDARLTVTSGVRADQWTMRRDGAELVVRTPEGPFRWWPGWWGGNGNGSAVLLLPQSLQGLDAALDLSAGSLTANGDFGRLQLSAGAGQLTVRGSADQITTDMSAGRANLRLADVRSADLTVSAGDLDAVFTGAQPQRVKLSASAGSMQVSVPRGDYTVTADTSAGSFDNRIGSTPGASSTVEVDVSAGRVILDAAG